MLEPCANTAALRAYEREQEAAEREYQADRDRALKEAQSEAKIILRDPALLGAAIGECEEPAEAAAALATLLITSTAVDDKRKARLVIAAAVARQACWRTGSSLRELLDSADEEEIARRIAEALP